MFRLSGTSFSSLLSPAFYLGEESEFTYGYYLGFVEFSVLQAREGGSFELLLCYAFGFVASVVEVRMCTFMFVCTQYMRVHIGNLQEMDTWLPAFSPVYTCRNA